MKYWLFRVRVSGESCWPLLVPGKTYWATNLRRPKVGDFVVFRHAAALEGYMIKKVRAAPGSALELGGTVSWSSRHRIAASDVVGTLLRPQHISDRNEVLVFIKTDCAAQVHDLLCKYRVIRRQIRQLSFPEGRGQPRGLRFRRP